VIDPLISLAFAVQSNKGVYSLLLGSGVSRSAQIPTGWEIVLDLTRKLATLHEEDCGADPEAWYRTKFAEEPDYSVLLDDLAKTPEARQQLLRPYFEPTEEERAQGVKQPTAAHRAIAQLVAGGYVRLIVTTNFDRLLERALEEASVVPIVISSPDQLRGMLPLIHQQCCVLKLHGDYLDTRIRNTPAELAEYDVEIDRTLDRVFDEFGLIVCGWSASWDEALRSAVERCPTRRFTTYWACRDGLNDRAAALLQSRRGVQIPIKSADDFFTALAEKVQALEGVSAAHPLSAAAAEATAKRLLSEDRHLIRLSDLVHEESEQAFATCEPLLNALLHASGNKAAKLSETVEALWARTEILRSLLINIAYWGKPIHWQLIVSAIERLAMNANEGQSGLTLNFECRIIPAISTMHGCGLAALARRELGTALTVLAAPRATHVDLPERLLEFSTWGRYQHLFKAIPGRERNYFPASEWLFERWREPLRRFVPSNTKYERLFDEFEVIRAIVVLLIGSGGRPLEGDLKWVPAGRFVWKHVREGRGDRTVMGELRTDKALYAALCEVGLFLGDEPAFANTVDCIENGVRQMSHQLH